MELKRGGFAHAMSATFTFNRTSIELKPKLIAEALGFELLLIEAVWN